ncbi:hypothetical protein A2482_01040 [Candidatus Falkowbacteria bacterium RIFOXYC2_FULL_48_21]|uniref:Uncharacterized protein n=1 Tax=Candidatus Falkowbacteria bacterium RIFOXYC2_FULL_48_21 TaxID=1798005 RepID=A0A1F5TBQ3_9BACT|nr:MAG: hypothetical protein A2482_01040 [Candidatus Falkowbacteria bacterium RIFOXYC2_FULL_48_21]
MTQGKKKSVLLRMIQRVEGEIAKLVKEEKALQARWEKGYARFKSAAEEQGGLKSLVTKKAESLRKVIMTWSGADLALMTKKQAVEDAKRSKELELESLKKDIAIMASEMANSDRELDDIVTRVFGLNDTVVEALEQREKYLSAHVFQRLVAPDGKKKTQVTFDSADRLRRVVVLVNHITRVQPDLAYQAQAKIQGFFDQFSTAAGMTDPKVKALYEITQAILVTSEKFKVGPDLYRFLQIEIDEGVFPDLYAAQKLLRGSLRSEKTTSYVRLYERTGLDKQWKSLPLH